MLKEIKKWAKYIAVLIAAIIIVAIIDRYYNKITSNLNIHMAKLEQATKLKHQANEKLNAVKLNLELIDEAQNDYPASNAEEEVLMLLDAVKKAALNNGMALISVKPQLDKIEGDDYLVRVDTVIKMLGSYSNLIKVLNELAGISKASSISDARIKFINHDSLNVELVITSLARPKLESVELKPIIKAFNDSLTDEESSVIFGKFVDLEAQRQAELERALQQKEGQTIDFTDDTDTNGINENTQDIYIEDVAGVSIPMNEDSEKVNDKTTVIMGIYPFKTKYPVNSNWGWRKSLASQEDEFHYGVDISAPKNTNVYALKDGEVEYAGQSDNYGNIVIIRYHDGLTSLYGHLGSYTVTKGQKVSKDTVVGFVGNNPNSSESILHVGLVVNKIFVNPNDYIDFN